MRPARILGAVVLVLVLAVQALGTDVVFFSSPWCGPCQQMKPVIAELEEQGVDVQKVDIDQRADLARKYGITEVPSLLIVRGGKIVDRIVGLTGVDRIVAALDRGGERISKRLGGDGQGIIRRLLRMPRTAREATVRVTGAPARLPSGKQGRGIGAGVLLVGTENGCLVGTAYHVVYDSGTGVLLSNGIGIQLSDGSEYEANLAQRNPSGYAIDKKADAALLLVPIKAEPFSFFATKPPAIGETLRICGFPHNGPWTVKEGRMSACPNCGERHDDATYSINGVNAIPGDSGGPIINQDGKVVGILSASNWDNRMAPESSLCASWESIYALCNATDYPFPPILPWRRHVEGEIQEIQAVMSDGQLPLPDAPNVGYLSAAVEARVGRLEAKIVTLEADIAALKAGQERILEIAEAAKQAAAASGSDFGKAFGERLDKIEAKNGDAYEDALAKAAAAKAAADAAKTKADGAVAAVEKDRETLRERVGQWVSQLPLVRQVGQLWTWAKWMTGGSIGMTVLICGVLFVLWRRIVKPDLRDFVESGGTNPTYLRQGTEAVTDVIPGTWDDKIGNAINNAFERFLRANPSLFGATPPAAPAPEAPK